MAKKCSFTGCENNVFSGGLCNGHYTQQYRGKKLTPLAAKKTPEPIINGNKKCKECKKTKPVSEFYVTGKKFGGGVKLSTDCKPCYSAKVVKRRK
jgi:hypothetical protein